MSVLLVRIDDRLVHGQIIEGWVKHLKATKVTVVNDLIVNNWARRAVMELALPSEVKLQPVSIDQIAERGDLLSANDDEREIVLFASPADVLMAIAKGLRLDNLNLGGMHHFNGTRSLTTNIALNNQDIEALKRLMEIGVAIKVCALPKDKGIDLNKLL